MSKFNHYAKDLERLTLEAVKKMNDADALATEARRRFEEMPEKIGASSDYVIERMHRQTACIEHEEAAKHAREIIPRELKKDLLELRAHLSEDVENYFSVDPSQLSPELMAILNSDILNARDIQKLMKAAEADGNTTAIRLLAKKADDLADRATDTEKRMSYKVIAKRVDNYKPETFMTAFDSLISISDRVMNNRRLAEAWNGQLSMDKVIEAF